MEGRRDHLARSLRGVECRKVLYKINHKKHENKMNCSSVSSFGKMSVWIWILLRFNAFYYCNVMWIGLLNGVLLHFS